MRNSISYARSPFNRVVSPHDLAGIAHALGGARETANGYDCLCPLHEGKGSTPSLSIAVRDGRLLCCCHSGCDGSLVFSAIVKRGLLANSLAEMHEWQGSNREVNENRERAIRRNQICAERIWDQSQDARGTVVDDYLAARGIDRLPIPFRLRFHQRLKHTPTGKTLPAMIALVSDAVTDRVMGIHRTWLRADGTGKANVEPNKMSLGPIANGVIRLAKHKEGKPLLIAEGIETALAGMQACNLPGWCAISAGNLSKLDLPGEIREVVVLADGDRAGRAAASRAAYRWARERRDVRIADAGDGVDFNDLLAKGK
jgi:putative DNA primase/helicase